MISMTTEKKKLYLSLFGIFFVIFILNSFMVRSAGDDYVYSFMWEGHSMYEPLSAGAGASWHTSLLCFFFGCRVVSLTW